MWNEETAVCEDDYGVRNCLSMRKYPPGLHYLLLSLLKFLDRRFYGTDTSGYALSSIVIVRVYNASSVDL